MKPQDAGNQSSAVGQHRRNPFDVMDVPNPNDPEVQEFDRSTKLEGTLDDENAKAWVTPNNRDHYGTIDGSWSSRWNGGLTPRSPEIRRKNGNKVKPK